MRFLNRIFPKRINKKYFYFVLSLTLACIFLFSNLDIGKTQVTNNSSQTNTAITNQLTLNTTSSIPNLTVIKTISPNIININNPQSLLFKEDDHNDQKQEIVITGENFPQSEDLEKREFQTEIQIGRYPYIAVAKATEVTKDRTAVFATFEEKELEKLSRGTYPVKVLVGGKATQIDPQLQANKNGLTVKVARPVNVWTTLMLSLITSVATALLWIFIYLLTKEVQPNKIARIHAHLSNRNRNSWRRIFIKLNLVIQWIILDSQTNTLSLARVQFVWWLTIIAWGYLFLFLGRGLIQGVWGFISLSGFAYTFLISLITLVTAQATTEIRGSKGSGEVHPGWSDLVVHGGVLALERVQQVIWNIIIGIAFIVILLVTYTTASSFPTIPNELLALMGISAGGYISGKAVRKPGPNINQVVCEPKNLYDPKQGKYLNIECIVIAGSHFSLGGKILKNNKAEANTDIKDAGVILQMSYIENDNEEIIEFKKDDIVTLKLDPNAPMEFCRKMKVDLATLPDQEWVNKFSKFYREGQVKITIINADGQRAVWDGFNIAPERELSQGTGVG